MFPPFKYPFLLFGPSLCLPLGKLPLSFLTLIREQDTGQSRHLYHCTCCRVTGREVPIVIVPEFNIFFSLTWCPAFRKTDILGLHEWC